MKIVINQCRGQFDLSELAIAHYAKRSKLALFLVRDYETILGKKYKQNFYYTKEKEKRVDKNDGLWSIKTIKRNDPILIDVVNELGAKSNTSYSKLVVVEVDSTKKWKITANDGLEKLEEVVA
jgi:hypothetical protein